MPDTGPKPKKFTEEVTTIKPHDHKTWPGSHERAIDNAGGKKKAE